MSQATIHTGEHGHGVDDDDDDDDDAYKVLEIFLVGRLFWGPKKGGITASRYPGT